MRRYLVVLALSFLVSVTGLSAKKLTVFQLNIWQEGTMVENGFDGIVEAILCTKPDIVLLSEVRNYNNRCFIDRIVKALKLRGQRYFGNQPTKLDVGVLSKYPLSEQMEIYPVGNGSGSILRVTARIGRKNVVVYSAHLNYTDYACYLPRGYDGSTWKKLAEPVVDPDSILRANRRSWRDESIRAFLEDASIVISRGDRVILGGDFNEPSHLDWQSEVSALWDHNGAVVAWDCSCLLQNGGFRDAYRMLYPDVIRYPGFTFPSDNPGAPLRRLAWAPDADERDRIDFIYYYPCSGFQPRKATLIGPDKSIVRNKRIAETTEDNFITPKSVWPSDHKGVLVEFSI